MTWPLFVNWHTPEYDGEAVRLHASLEQYTLPHEIHCSPSLGSWGRNCNHKPVFIREVLRRAGGPVVWLDADSELVDFPFALLPAPLGAADLAYCQRPPAAGGGLEGQASLIYFRHCGPVFSFLDAWAGRCREVYLTTDQHHLNALIGSGCFGDLTRLILPVSYCVMPEDSRAGAVVLQHQASRRLLPLVGCEPPPPPPTAEAARRASLRGGGA